MVLTLAILFMAHGSRGTFMKFAQKDRVSTLPQAIVHITVYSFLQLVILLAVPPYPSLICEPEFLIYPLGFAAFYNAGYVMLIMAMSEGSTSITNTINSFNCLVPVFFGLIVWGEKMSVCKTIGLMLFIIGLLLYNRSSYSVGGVKQKISPKWLWHTLASVLLTGIAVIFTKISMRSFPDYGEQYLIYYTLFSTIIGSALVLLRARKDAAVLCRDKKFWANTGVAAVALDVSNYIFVTFINLFPGVLFLPMCSVVAMLGVMVFGRVLLKEKISKSALISSVICIAAIVLLNF